jgi:hypothetical protein
MSNEFAKPSDEIIRISEEINLLRRDLQQVAGALSRIERRLKATFPNYPARQKTDRAIPRTKPPPSHLTPQELQQLFNDAVAATQADGDNGFQRRVSDTSDSDIIALAVEIGMGASSSLTRNKAIGGVRKRVQEAIQLQPRDRKST